MQRSKVIDRVVFLVLRVVNGCVVACRPEGDVEATRHGSPFSFLRTCSHFLFSRTLLS